MSSITFRVSEGKFDRLISNLTTVTNYTRPTRLIFRVLDCQKLYVILYGCLSFVLFIIDNKKFNFLESIVLFLLFFQISLTQNSTYHTPNIFISFDSSINTKIKPLYCKRTLHSSFCLLVREGLSVPLHGSSCQTVMFISGKNC